MTDVERALLTGLILAFGALALAVLVISASVLVTLDRACAA